MLIVGPTRHHNTLVVDHSKAGLRNIMKELDLGGAASSDKVYKVSSKLIYVNYKTYQINN